ncbi:Olfactory receptor 7E24 [Sciurus carolinensis]|uniref:Olfactory receptor 7E24 n=1 Tax=Sciurus carolinensis TaxID=30640 RepID=A0AA41MY82_SCICA|nr:Olfactory receptor 7E24 [Sciurus carolinensis]
MKFSNETGISEFLLLGLTEDPALQPLIFSLFLSMYLVTVLGNLLIILAVSSVPHLHTAMYFFLCCLSFNDIAYTTCTIPQMLVNIQTEDQTITCTGFLTQVSFVIVVKLACSDTLLNNILVYVVTSMLGGVPLLGIIYSYIKIISSILRISSSGGKHKAFSTCGSHLSVISLFFGTAFGVYISSAFTDSTRKTAIASLMYTVVPQMLNPFIYSLRNRDMKEALRKLIRTSPFL